MSNPCKDCQERTWDCKKTCPDWEEYETAHMQELEERRKIYMQNADYNSFKLDAKERNRGYKRTRKGAWKRV